MSKKKEITISVEDFENLIAIKVRAQTLLNFIESDDWGVYRETIGDTVSLAKSLRKVLPCD